MEIDDYERQTGLLEKFLENGDKTAFRKMLNMNLTTSSAEKKKETEMKRKLFFHSFKNKKPSYYFNNINNNFNLNSNNHSIFNPNEINSFKLDFHNIIQDPEFKDKCMRGNYKWAKMKFELMKANLAKRKGISIENFQMPKIFNKKRYNMEMNGKFVMERNGFTSNNKENYNMNNMMNKDVNTFKVKNSEYVKRSTSQKPVNSGINFHM